ncbi:heparinase II/III family protein [Paenibacillus rubinfantis]|uniref:heparinase II/III family protein n=1 Tax=Paenibacillus rubinfantis TaxID=1720296 RepID=UPI00073E7A67|nr:heparinase II/III family protein [Paenibacillus rubinfantis]
MSALEGWEKLTEGWAPLKAEDYYPVSGSGATFWKLLREAADARSELEVIRAEGERLLSSPAEELTYSLFSLFRVQGSRLEYERVYFEKRRRLNTFAFLSLLEPESKRYEAALWDAVWAICSEFTWCLPAHVDDKRIVSETIDLFAAETGFALAELSLLLGERLPELLRVRIAELVEERLFRPFLENGPYHWEELTNNWSAVCAGSIGSAALLLMEKEQDHARLARILEKTERSMGFYLQGFGEDGACPEGLGYWNYGFGYFVYYADLLLKRSRGQRDWFREDKVRRIAGFQQKCFLGGRLVANFSDTQPYGSVHPGLSHYLAERYAEVEAPPAALYADYREDHCSRWAPALRNLIWRDHAAAGAAEWRDGDFTFEDAVWLISRFTAAAGTFGFAAKGGHNGESHNHNDLGHFMLAGGGEFFLSDLGCGEYTRNYFGEARYMYDCNGSQGHSVPRINGHLQQEGEERGASLIRWETSEETCGLELELSGAYEDEQLRSFKRSWVWTKTDLPSLSLRDEFAFIEAPGSLVERFVTPIRPEVAGPGILRFARAGLALELHYDPEQLEAEVEERTYRDHYGKDTVWFALDIRVRQPQVGMGIDFLFKFVTH